MADFTDSKLSPRARHLALWLCDLTNTALDRASRDASADLLLRELPDFWTADECRSFARDIRAQVGPKASHIAWLHAAGWLVGEEERLPDRPSQRMSEAARFTTQRRVRDLLATLTPPQPKRGAERSEAQRAWDESAAFVARVTAAVRARQGPQ